MNQETSGRNSQKNVLVDVGWHVMVWLTFSAIAVIFLNSCFYAPWPKPLGMLALLSFGVLVMAAIALFEIALDKEKALSALMVIASAVLVFFIVQDCAVAGQPPSWRIVLRALGVLVAALLQRTWLKRMKARSRNGETAHQYDN